MLSSSSTHRSKGIELSTRCSLHSQITYVSTRQLLRYRRSREKAISTTISNRVVPFVALKFHVEKANAASTSIIQVDIEDKPEDMRSSRDFDTCSPLVLNLSDLYQQLIPMNLHETLQMQRNRMYEQVSESRCELNLSISAQCSDVSVKVDLEVLVTSGRGYGAFACCSCFTLPLNLDKLFKAYGFFRH
jgi:hypothetical protein